MNKFLVEKPIPKVKNVSVLFQTMAVCHLVSCISHLSSVPFLSTIFCTFKPQPREIEEDCDKRSFNKGSASRMRYTTLFKATIIDEYLEKNKATQNYLKMSLPFQKILLKPFSLNG